MAIKPRNRAQTVSDLISAARAQLEHTAYEQVRTRDIAEEAGCTHGLITQYFGSKLGLYTQVLQDIAAEINDLISNGLSVDQLVTYPLSSTYWRLLAALKVDTAKLNSSTSGAGPDALPPNVLSLAPAGRTRETSHLGISPAHRSART